VLTGSGTRAFCAGIDLNRMGDFYRQPPGEDRVRAWSRRPGIGGITRNLDVGKPVIAAINGACLGLGLELALACDLRLASDTASFGLPEVRAAIIPGQGGTQRLPRAVPAAVASEMILTGNPINARRALEVGLVSQLYSPDRLVEGARALAATIAALPPRVVRTAREAVRRGLDTPLEAGLRLELELADPLRDSPNNREARAAFREKRPPRWTTS
jgi:E-phenylitaconyl-CoA hydratase